MSMPHSHHSALYDVKGDEHQGEDEAFVKDRVDERFMTKARSEAEVFGGEEDLCEDERVDDRKGVLLVVQMMLREDDAFVEREQSEDDPEVKEDDEESLKFFEAFCFRLS